MKKILLILSIPMILVSCGPCQDETPISSETEEYEVVDFNPPKHAGVSLRRKSDNRIFNDISLGKRCSNWESKGTLGRVVLLTRYTYNYDGGRDIVDFNSEELKECFCD